MIDWQPYLDSVCEKYQHWWDVYTLTDATHRSREKSNVPLLDNLMAELIQPEKPDTPGEEEKSEGKS